MVANYLTVGLLAIMVFYSFGVAINVHRALDKENAGKLLRKLFPVYFLWGILISVIAEIIEVTIPTPAEGPSFGVAPSGT